MSDRPRVAILGGGMAGLAAAWRLSEPGWQDELSGITVYQRGWRLGGKGASSRGRHGRIEEHGLHIWLGYYENAFRLLRECYEELDRPRTDPECPIRSWRDAIFPAPEVGLMHPTGTGWHPWVGSFSTNDLVPGEPDAEGGEMTVVELVRRGLVLLRDFVTSLPTPSSPAVVISPHAQPPAPVDGVATRLVVDLVDVVLATMRGILADGLLTHPHGFRAINDEDYRDWLRRHGAPDTALDSTLVKGLYDLVFAHEDGDPDRLRFAAGWGVFLSGKTFFDYKGAIFWKMAAGMGDVVFAPLFEALRQRGVQIELFHRVDGLHLSDDRSVVDAISVGRQARLAPDRSRYEPLIRVKGLPCFPSQPLVDQLVGAEGIEGQPLEAAWCQWPDAEKVVLRRGEDFDVVVVAMSLGALPSVCAELVDDRPEWRAMVDQIGTVATQALQLWLRPDERELGWDRPGVTTSGHVKPFETWASMPQLVERESWPAGDEPGTIAYFCSTLDAPPPDGAPDPGWAAAQHERVRTHAERFVSDHLSALLPGFASSAGPRSELLCGSNGDHERRGPLDGQHWSANVDPSDRYVQSLPGTDRFRLRPDESGYDNVVLAGDWTDCGLNAGCIEAAVISGLQAANAILGRSRMHRIAGLHLP